MIWQKPRNSMSTDILLKQQRFLRTCCVKQKRYYQQKNNTMNTDYRKEIEDLISLIVKEGASDLHLSEGRPPIIRVNSNLIPLFKRAVISAADMKGFADQFISP